MVSWLSYWTKTILSRLSFIDFWRNKTTLRILRLFYEILCGISLWQVFWIVVVHSFIDRPVVGMNSVDDVLVVMFVNRRTDWSSNFIHRSSMAGKSWTYLHLLLRIKIVIDIALDHTLLFLGVFTRFIALWNVLKITILDFDVLWATCLLQDFMLLFSRHM